MSFPDLSRAEDLRLPKGTRRTEEGSEEKSQRKGRRVEGRETLGLTTSIELGIVSEHLSAGKSGRRGKKSGI